MTASDLFEYRIRKFGLAWIVICDDQRGFSTYKEARSYADRLDKRGYVDGDK